jgi:hypothetical protein
MVGKRGTLREGGLGLQLNDRGCKKRFLRKKYLLLYLHLSSLLPPFCASIWRKIRRMKYKQKVEDVVLVLQEPIAKNLQDGQAVETVGESQGRAKKNTRHI